MTWTLISKDGPRSYDHFLTALAFNRFLLFGGSVYRTNSWTLDLVKSGEKWRAEWVEKNDILPNKMLIQNAVTLKTHNGFSIVCMVYKPRTLQLVTVDVE